MNIYSDQDYLSGRRDNHITATRPQGSLLKIFQSASIILTHLGLPNPRSRCACRKNQEAARASSQAKQASKLVRRLTMHHCTPHLSKRRSFAAFRDWTPPNPMLIIHQEDYFHYQSLCPVRQEGFRSFFTINPVSFVLTPHHWHRSCRCLDHHR